MPLTAMGMTRIIQSHIWDVKLVQLSLVKLNTELPLLKLEQLGFLGLLEQSNGILN